MWWIPLHAIIVNLLPALAGLYHASFGPAFYEFIMLGIIPGTDIRISFTTVLIVAAFFWLFIFVTYHRKHRVPRQSSQVANFDYIAL